MTPPRRQAGRHVPYRTLTPIGYSPSCVRFAWLAYRQIGAFSTQYLDVFFDIQGCHWSLLLNAARHSPRKDLQEKGKPT